MIENYVTSFIEGRVRLRHPIFKNMEVVTQVQELLQNMPGVESLTHNPRTGSLLLEYDPELLDQETLLAMLQQGEEWLALNTDYTIEPTQESLTALKEKVCALMPTSCALPYLDSLTKGEKRRLFNRTMALSYGVSMVSLLVNTKRTHVIAGSLFFALSLWHIKRMRKAIL